MGRLRARLDSGLGRFVKPSPAQRHRRPVIALTVGDPSGIGPEILARTLASRGLWRRAVPLVFGNVELLARASGLRKRAGLSLAAHRGRRPTSPAFVALLQSGDALPQPGRPDLAGAWLQLRSIEAACDAVERGDADALCTAPVSKAQIASVQPGFVGHTEFLAKRFGARVLMMLAGPRLRVAVATTHLALRDVPDRLIRRNLVDDLKLLSAELIERFGRKKPRIAVTGLNPHAGEQGHFGREEIDVIGPAIVDAREAGVLVEGPFAADGLFPRALRGDYDAVLAMYHDQGLIPVKLAHFDTAVNVTLGLPFPRTSPDHGVAYDLAGKGQANPSSMIAAARLAISLATGGQR
jgi:4-hydroxythreonine-4-phosphate dehydrogenase